MKGAPSFSPLQKSASIVSAVGGGIKCIHIAGNRNRRSEKSRKTDLGKEYSLGQTPVIEVLLKFLLVDCQTDCGTLRKHLTNTWNKLLRQTAREMILNPRLIQGREERREKENHSLARPAGRSRRDKKVHWLPDRDRDRLSWKTNGKKERGESGAERRRNEDQSGNSALIEGQGKRDARQVRRSAIL